MLREQKRSCYYRVGVLTTTFWPAIIIQVPARMHWLHPIALVWLFCFGSGLHPAHFASQILVVFSMNNLPSVGKLATQIFNVVLDS